jgi:predicted Zn-dependent protease
MSPTSVEPYLMRAAVAAAQKNWTGAEAECRTALRLNPLQPHARLMLAIALHNGGNPGAGRAEAATALGLALNPQQKSAFQDRYRRETR